MLGNIHGSIDEWKLIILNVNSKMRTTISALYFGKEPVNGHRFQFSFQHIEPDAPKFVLDNWKRFNFGERNYSIRCISYVSTPNDCSFARKRPSWVSACWREQFLDFWSFLLIKTISQSSRDSKIDTKVLISYCPCSSPLPSFSVLNRKMVLDTGRIQLPHHLTQTHSRCRVNM